MWRWFAGGIGVGAYAWWVTGLEPFSTVSAGAVVGSGVIAMMVRRRAAPPATTVSPVGALLWVTVLAALAGWQLASYLQHPRSQYPTLSSLANAVLDPRPVRAVAFVAWLVAAARLAR